MHTQLLKSRHPIMVILTMLCLSQFLHGQEEPPNISAEIRFAATSIIEKKHTLWLRTGPEKNAVKVSLNTRSFTRPVNYKGPAIAQIYSDKDMAESAEPTVPPLLTIRLQTGASLAILLPKEDGSPYRGYITRGNDFPYGSIQFYNFSKAEILIKNGSKEQQVQLHPGKNKILRIKTGQQSMDMLIAAKSPDKKPRIIRQTKFTTSPNWREMILIFDNPKTNRVSLRHFIDTQSAKQRN
jgi:hypothetical protein